MTIGEKIYQFRNSLNLTQKQFAEKAGVAQSAVNFWENGKRQPRIEQLKKIATAFNISLSELLESDEFAIIDIKETPHKWGIKDKPPQPDTLAAHFDGEDYTDEELEEIRQFAEFVKNRNRKKE